MTKAEILKRLKELDDAQSKTVDQMSNLIKLPRVGADAILIASILGTINATIFDTMTSLAMILIEMIPEEREKAPEKAPVPMKGEHYYMCQSGSSRSCLCNSCANDHNSDEHRHACCTEHGFECNVTKCPDYVKEDRDA